MQNFEQRFFLLALLAGLLGALVTAIDNFIIKQVIVAPADSFTAVLVYLVLGGWIGIAMNMLTSTLVGARIDVNFKGIMAIPWALQKRAIFSGIASGVATMFSIWGAQMVDPSLVAILGQMALVYIVIYDVMGGRIQFKSILVPTLIVVFGAVLASLKSVTEFSADINGLIVLAVFSSGLVTVAQIFDQREMQVGQIDAVNYAFWRFVWLALTGTVLAILISIARLQFAYFLELAFSLFLPALPFICGLMIVVTIMNAVQVQARRFGHASLVALLATVKLVAIVPITVIGNSITPEMFGALPEDQIVWGIRLLGGALVIVGVDRLRRYTSTGNSTRQANI